MHANLLQQQHSICCAITLPSAPAIAISIACLTGFHCSPTTYTCWAIELVWEAAKRIIVVRVAAAAAAPTPTPARYQWRIQFALCFTDNDNEKAKAKESLPSRLLAAKRVSCSQCLLAFTYLTIHIWHKTYMLIAQRLPPQSKLSGLVSSWVLFIVFRSFIQRWGEVKVAW